MSYIIISTVMAFIAVIGFCILFDVPENELVFCGFTGGIGWLINIGTQICFSEVTAVLLSTIVITIISCVLARIRKKPFTVFLIGGIIPLVPGGMVYYTMLDIINGRTQQAVSDFLLSARLALAISVGIIIILPFAKSIYTMKKHLKEK